MFECPVDKVSIIRDKPGYGPKMRIEVADSIEHFSAECHVTSRHQIKKLRRGLESDAFFEGSYRHRLVTAVIKLHATPDSGYGGVRVELPQYGRNPIDVGDAIVIGKGA